jgi:hypothetical protein
MTVDLSLRQYVALRATPELLAVYPKPPQHQREREKALADKRPKISPFAQVQAFTAGLLNKLSAPPELANRMRVVAAPSFNATPEIVELNGKRGLPQPPLPDAVIVAYAFDDLAALVQFRELVQRNLGKTIDADNNAFLQIGADIGGTTEDHYCPTDIDDFAFADRAAARRLLGADTLVRSGLKGRNVNVVIVDEGLDRTRIPLANWGGGWSVQISPGVVRQPGMTSPGAHALMIAHNVLDLAPEAVIYDLPLIPPRIANVPLFISSADAIWQSVLSYIRILRTFPQWSGPWLMVNAWGIFDRASENPLGDYTERPSHPFNITVRDTVASDQIDVVFAAGNCGQFCPSPRCGPHDRGPGHSIYGANSHPMVLTAGAVLSDEMWLGYSSEGPGQPLLSSAKPDLCAPSNFRETRDASALNTGTSAACALVAGAVAALRSGWPAATVPPQALKMLLNFTAAQPHGPAPWNGRFGYGILDLEAAVSALASQFP